MGLFLSTRIYPDQDLLDLSGRVAIVTGANSGIGFYILAHLLRRGAKVYLAARTESDADAAIIRLEKESLVPEAGEVVPFHFDLEDPLQTKSAAVWFMEREKRLDILVNNAAKLAGPYRQTPDGFSDSIMINYISPFLFTHTLLPLLESTARQPGSDVRIVNVSSVAHRWVSSPRYDSLEALNSDFSHTQHPKMGVYAYTKLAIMLWTKELQRGFDRMGTPIIAMAVHPGKILSEGTSRMFLDMPFGHLVHWVLSPFLLKPFEGGYTPAWGAAARKVRDKRGMYAGAYLVPFGKVEEASKDARRDDLAQELLQTTERILEAF